MKNAIRAMMCSEITVSSSESTTIASTTRPMIRNPRSVGFMSLQIRFTSAPCQVRAYGQGRRQQGSAGEPEQAAARLVRRVQPGSEHRGERERSVRVVEVVARAAGCPEAEEAPGPPGPPTA